MFVLSHLLTDLGEIRQRGIYTIYEVEQQCFVQIGRGKAVLVLWA
jgi:hypothetical protein